MFNDDNITVIEDTATQQVTDLLSGDNWYKLHPENILGMAYESSGRFGKVTKYKGGMDVLARIEVDLSFIGADKALNDPLASVSHSINTSAAALQPEVQGIIIGALAKAEEELKSIRKRKNKPVVDEDAIVKPVAETKSFREMYFELNPEISLAELEVYVWYKTHIGKPLSKNYVAIFNPDLFSDTEDLRQTYKYNVDEDKIADWVNEGLLFYFEGKLVPAFEYLSGDMYSKKLALNREQEAIVEKYGQVVYDKQIAAIVDAYRQVYDRRLVIGGANSLVVLVTSRFAREFYVERIDDIPEEKKFRIKKVTAPSNKDFGKPDIYGDLNSYDRDRTEFDTLNLVDAFGWWMLNSRPGLKEPVSHLDIVKYYVMQSPIRIPAEDDSPEAKAAADAKKEKLKSSTQREGERLFAEFLETQLLPNDKIRLETQWNMDFNNHLPPNLNKIPVAFTMARYIMGKEEVIRPEKREAVAFTMYNGTGILSYDVGVGKTPSAIFTIAAFLDAGYCKYPLITVPNQVYKQFISEIKMFAPQIPVMEGYNLSKEYIENFKDASGKVVTPPRGSVTVMTYEGFENIGFTESTTSELISGLYEILNQGGESERDGSKKGEKQKASFQDRLAMIVGRGLEGGRFNIEDFGFDFICYDEAHKMKKVFTSVKGEAEEEKGGKVTRGKNPYVISSGSPSSIALKGFMINYYILRRNNFKNILLLTATPFTNSPLEIFSMLSMVAYEQLRDTNLNNLKTFFDTYVKTSTELVINTRLRPEFKQVILGFNNLISLQSLIRKYILYKTGEDVNIVRPEKYVLPYLHEIDNGISVQLPPERRVETYLEMTSMQKAMMDDIIAYVEGGMSEDELESNNRAGADSGNGPVDEDETTDNTAGIEVGLSELNEAEKRGVRTIKGLSYSRNLALSPYLYEHSGLGIPDFRQYVETSPKLTYVMMCVKSVRDYHISRGEPVSGQVIYMDRGVQYFPLLKKYLVEVVGYAEHEVGIIQSGLPKNGARSKEYVKNLFNGEIYNDKTKEFETVPFERRMKVCIGSSSIKEGMNLQKYGTVLYNCFIDWNPTDIQQLEGRIYRQKNTFDAVRIVNPLVIDSADIFLFQKLQEKTKRLNTIWSTDGKTNVLNTEDFNPEELKYALIKNPVVIAELKSIELKSKLDSDILGLDRQKEIAQRVMVAAGTINQYFDKVIESLEGYRDFKPGNNKLDDAVRLIPIVNELNRTQKDKDGKKIHNQWAKKYLSEKEQLEASPLESVYGKPYWFDNFAVAVRDLKRSSNDFIRQYNIPFALDNYKDSLNDFIKTIDDKITEIREQIKNIDSPEYKQILVQQAIEEKERQQIEYKPLVEIVKDFSKMNYLLSRTRVIETVVAPKYTTCPPTLPDGTLAIDDEAIDVLEKCLGKLPQTKELFYNSENGYTAEREQLHQKIEDEVFEGVKCVSKTQPIAVFTGGPTASGKSTFLKKRADYLLNDDVFKLDADEVRAMLPEYKGWNANQTHLETQDIVNDLINKIGSSDCRYDMVYDGTMNKAKKYFDLINKIKALDYKVFIIFMEVPYSEAKKRALARYQRTGRYVPAEVIDDFFTKTGSKTRGQAALDELKPLVDGYIVVDGVTGEIIDKGGEPLPEKRNPDVYVTPTKAIESPTPVTDKAPDNKQIIMNYIKTLNLSLKYAPESDKAEIKKRIKGLELSLKYS